jgi:hypothetical protein
MELVGQKETQKRDFRTMSWETTTIYNRLLLATEGETILYTELSALLRVQDIRRKHRYCIDTARRRLLIDKHMMFKTVVNKGLIRLNNEEKVSSGSRALRKVRSAVRHGKMHLQAIEIDALSEESKSKALATYSLLGAISLFTAKRMQNRLEEKTKETSHFLNFTPDLDQFR